MAQNENADDITVQHPRFLEVSAPEVVALPNREEAISRFNSVNKTEWVDKKKKKDGRRNKRSLLAYWGDAV